MSLPVLFAFQNLVVGETCPAPVDVEARVRAILHLTPTQELSEGFAVERHEAGLYVELRSSDSTLIGQRTLPIRGDCDELAQASAVVLSAWLSDAHPDFAGALPPLEPAPAASPPTPEPVAPPPPAPVSAPPLRAAPPARPRVTRRGELGLGLGAEYAGSKLAASAVVFAGYAPELRGWGLSAFCAAVWPRREELGPGFVDWRRWPLGVGPSWRLATAATTWELAAGPALAWLHFDGSNFAPSGSSGGFSWGGFFNARVATRGRHVGAFGLAQVQVYPGDFGAVAEGVTGVALVPRFAYTLAVGAWFSR